MILKTLAATVATLAVTASPVLAEDLGPAFKAVSDKVAPSVVTVNLVLKMTTKGENGAEESEENRDTEHGVLVTPDGLVMLSNIAFSSKRIASLMGADEQAADSVKLTPTSFKVVIGKEDKEYNAFLAATDTNMDVAFLKIEGLGDRKLPYIDFSTSVEPAIGQTLLGVVRLDKGYDYATMVVDAIVRGEVTKPRHAWVMDSPVTHLGLPVFTTKGELAGLMDIIVPAGSAEERDGNNVMFILPASAVKSTVEQAAKRAGELAIERAKAKPAAAPTPAAAAPKKTTGK